MTNLETKKVAGTIVRKTMLYQTGVEYGDYCANFVQGCAHGCKYPCYAMLLAKRTGKVKTYEEWCRPYLVSNALDILDNEIPKLKNKIKHVQLCFTTDPFMFGYLEVKLMAMMVIKKLNDAGIKCVVLTKGILPVELSLISKENEYGITLVTLDESFREVYEPNTAPLQERLQALRQLHDLGCKTWVSMEPYPTPNLCEQDLEALLKEVSFVDKIIFGRANYSKEVTGYKDNKQFYRDCAEDVIKFCEEHGIAWHIKEKTLQ